MATSIVKADELRLLNDNVLMSNGALTGNVTFPAGHVIQTKQFIFSKTASTTSGSFVQISDGSGIDFKDSITVKANSKILIRAILSIGSTGNQGFFVDLFKSSDGSSFSAVTELHSTASAIAGTNAAIPLFHAGQSGNRTEKAALEYLDTITSAGTYHYALYYRRGSTGTTVINISPSQTGGSTNEDYGSSSSVMTLMEIAG